jgi:membrane protease subunit (stomatin/prohibitin family)
MATIQRPADSALALFWRSPAGAVPVGTTLVVGEKDCVVASRDGVILGVISPGTHSLEPQSFPFLASSVDASSNVTAELWFVRTSPFQGCKFGGSLGNVYDASVERSVTPRVAFEYSLTVIDAPALVQASMGMKEQDAVLGAVGNIVLREMRDVCARFVAEKHSVLQLVGSRLTDQLAPMQGQLRPLGLAVTVGKYDIILSNEDREALLQVNAARAKIQREAKIAEIQKAQAATAAPAGGGVPAIAPPQGPGSSQAGPAPGAAKRARGGSSSRSSSEWSSSPAPSRSWCTSPTASRARRLPPERLTTRSTASTEGGEDLVRHRRAERADPRADRCSVNRSRWGRPSSGR